MELVRARYIAMIMGMLWTLNEEEKEVLMMVIYEAMQESRRFSMIVHELMLHLVLLCYSFARSVSHTTINLISISI